MRWPKSKWVPERGPRAMLQYPLTSRSIENAKNEAKMTEGSGWGEKVIREVPLSDASPGSEAVILSIPLIEPLDQTRRQPQKGLGVDPIQWCWDHKEKQIGPDCIACFNLDLSLANLCPGAKDSTAWALAPWCKACIIETFVLGFGLFYDCLMLLLFCPLDAS